jgi:hypothetical protein
MSGRRFNNRSARRAAPTSYAKRQGPRPQLEAAPEGHKPPACPTSPTSASGPMAALRALERHVAEARLAEALWAGMNTKDEAGAGPTRGRKRLLNI